jgi:hypothetical protein
MQLIVIISDMKIVRCQVSTSPHVDALKSRFLIVQARAEPGVGFLLDRDEQVVVERGEHRFVRALPDAGSQSEAPRRSRQRVGDDAVFDRAEQHVRDRRDKGDQE